LTKKEKKVTKTNCLPSVWAICNASNNVITPDNHYRLVAPTNLP